MSIDTWRSLIFEVTRSILSVLIVVGGGYIIFSQPNSAGATIAAGFIGSVVTLYLYQSAAQHTTAQTLNTLRAAGVDPHPSPR